MLTINPGLHDGISEPPLAERALFASRDMDETYEKVSRVFKPHAIRRTTRTPIDARLNQLKMQDASLVYIQYGTDIEVDPGPLDSFYLVHMAAHGTSMVSGGRGRVMTGVNRAAVCSPDEPFRFHWSADCGVLAVRIKKDALERHYEALAKRPLNGPLRFDPSMSLNSGPGQSWAHLIRFILTDAKNPAGLTTDPRGKAQMAATMMTTLLTLHPHSHSVFVQSAASPAAPRHVRRAEDYMRANLGEPLTVADIARAADISERALFNGFKQFRGISPMAYFTQLRLDKTHDTLKTATPAQTVADIAMQWGFYHLGGFAAKYRRRFGENPSETLRRG